MIEQLPAGWASASFMKILDIQGGTQPPKSVFKYQPTEGYVRLLQIRDFGEKPLPTFIPRKATLKTCRTNDVLIARYGASIGRICTGMEGAYNVALAKVVIPKPLESRFIYHLLRSPIFQRPILDIERSAQDGFNKDDLVEITLPIAPVAEQRRISTKLDELLGRVGECQHRMSKIPVLLKRFRRSVLAAACSGRLTADWREQHVDCKPIAELLDQIAKEQKEVLHRKPRAAGDNRDWDYELEIPSTWSVCVFDEIAATKPNAIKAGPFGSSLTKACYVPAGFKIYGQEQVISGDPNYGDYYINQDKFEELQSCEVDAGDILVSLVGTIGRVLILPQEFQRGIINPRLAKLSLYPSIDREYIAHYLMSPLAINSLSYHSHGGTMDILNLRILRTLPIPLPPTDEQREIVRRVRQLFRLADKIEAMYRNAQTQVGRLSQSILAKAFQGELVPNEAELAEAEGRSFESAEELLRLISSNPQRTGVGKNDTNSQLRHPRQSQGRRHSQLPR